MEKKKEMNQMEKLICSKLHEIEKENNVKILLTDLEKLWENIFLQRKSFFLYISMAEGNYREYLKTEMVRAKKYFYVLRPVLACRWILERGTPPPMLFRELMESELPKELVPEVEKLLDLKMNSPEIKRNSTR